jgi:dihydrofolate reductase
MSKVVFSMSMSLDGFMQADNVRPDEPLGDGGQRLHEWVFGDDPTNQRLLKEAIASAGATICGRRMYDHSLPWWGADGPTSPARLPVFVVTHNPPDESPEGGVYTFVTGGIQAALQQATAVAGDKMVAVGGGADIGQQFIKAGLVDEITIHLVPVLFGSGTRMFENIVGKEHVQLEAANVVHTPTATHLTYRVVKP